jgi:predicted RNA methylase
LIEALKAGGVEGATLPDIGGGIGAIQHKLLGAGVAQAISVDASDPYLDAAREESRRRGHDGRVTFMRGDFVDLADSVAPAEVRT